MSKKLQKVSDNKTVCIVGSHSRTRENAPWDDPTKDIWVLNEAANIQKRDPETQEKTGEYWVKRCDGVLQIHQPVVYRNPLNITDPDHWEWLQQEHDFPIYMIDEDPDVPASVKFPIDDIIQDFLFDFRHMEKDGEIITEFTSSFPYAISLAIYLGYEQIDIYGVELESSTEYEGQREGLKFWQGFALGRGVKINMYSGAKLYPERLYGYEGFSVDLDEEYIFQDYKSLQKQFKRMDKENGHLRKMVEQAIKGHDYKKVGELVHELGKALHEQGKIGGRIAELERYKEKRFVIEKTTDNIAFTDRQEYEVMAGRAMLRRESYLYEQIKREGLLDYFIGTWKLYVESGDKAMAERSRQDLATIIFGNDKYDGYIKFCYMQGNELGNHDQNLDFMMEIDRRIDAAGGQKAVAAFKDNGKVPA